MEVERSSGLEITSKYSDSCESVIRHRLARIAELTGRELTTALVKIWVDDLRDVPVKQLAAALDQIEKSCHFFPTPGDVRELVKQAEALLTAHTLEQEWQKVLRALERFSSDVDTVPKLGDETDYAVRAAGGFVELWNMNTEELQWAKKRFLEAFGRREQLIGKENLLSESDAHKFLGELREYAKPQLEEKKCTQPSAR